MTGYPESITDPSYAGQILTLTYPLIGNYGVPEFTRADQMLENFESEQIHVRGLVISQYSENYSHWNAGMSLSEWLISQNIPAIHGIDTRALTKAIRQEGAMPGKIIIDDDIPFYDPARDNLVADVSVSEPVVYGNGRYRILLIDCGVKNNIIRCLLKRDTTLIRVPWNHDCSNEDYDGLFITNGPGDPKQCEETIATLRNAFSDNRPLFGICLGNQLMGLAAGMDTYKLKYGHRSHNQPVLMNGTNRTFITSQNHGYVLDNNSMPEGWQPLFTNLNDNTNEGMRHKSKPFFSTQFHPEASSGPTDTEFLFDRFMTDVRNYCKTRG
jgi:carbamoyl-phosphate synthase small subunit